MRLRCWRIRSAPAPMRRTSASVEAAPSPASTHWKPSSVVTVTLGETGANDGRSKLLTCSPLTAGERVTLGPFSTPRYTLRSSGEPTIVGSSCGDVPRYDARSSELGAETAGSLPGPRGSASAAGAAKAATAKPRTRDLRILRFLRYIVASFGCERT